MNTLVSYARLLPITVWLVVIGFSISCSELGDTGTPIQGSFTYPNISVFRGEATNVSPTWSGASAEQTVSYTIDPATDGIAINTGTGVISVAIDAPVLSNTFTVTAQGRGGYTGANTATLLLVVSAPIQGSFAYADLITFEGQATDVSPTWSGASAEQAVSYTMNPAAAGIAINAGTGVISVATNAPALSNTFTVTAQGSGGYIGTTNTTVLVVVKSVITLTGHSGFVHFVAWNPAGTRLASGSWDNTIKIWDPTNTNALRTLTGHSAAVFSVAWNSNGTRLASGSQDKTIKIWDPTNTNALRTLTGHSDVVRSVVWSPDGSRLASGSLDKTSKIWDPNSATVTRTLTGHNKWVWSMAWNPAGTLLASGGYDNTVKIWNPNNTTALRTLTGHTGYTGYVKSVTWNYDGTLLASGSADNTIKIWSPNNTTALRTLTGHNESVQSVAWNPAGTRLASGSDDKSINIWDPNTGELLYALTGHEHPIFTVAWNPAGTLLASGSRNNTIKIWDVSGL